MDLERVVKVEQVLGSERDESGTLAMLGTTRRGLTFRQGKERARSEPVLWTGSHFRWVSHRSQIPFLENVTYFPTTYSKSLKSSPVQLFCLFIVRK